MAIKECRECHHEVSTEATACPGCGAPKPADQTWGGIGYEWKSNATFSGVSRMEHGAQGPGRIEYFRQIGEQLGLL